MLQRFLQLPLITHFSTTKHSSTTVFHSSCCHDFYNCHWLLIFQPANTTALTTANTTRYTTGIDYTLHSSCCSSHWNSLFALATTSKHNCIDNGIQTTKHNSCCHNFYNCHWSLIFQPPSTAAQQLPQFLLPRFRQLPLTIDCSASKHNRHWQQQMQRDKQHASTTPSTVRVAIPIEIVYLHLPQPASTTALTTPSSFRVAFHQLSSIIHGLFYFWLFSQQTQPQLLWLHPLHFVLQFPLPLGSHFPPPLTTQTTSCSIVPSPTSKHNEIHVWAFTIASTHHFASAMQSAHHPSSNQQTQPQRALTTASTAMTPPLTTCCSPSKHSTLHSSSSISHSTTAISTGSPSS